MRIAPLLLVLTLACDLSIEPRAPYTNVFDVIARVSAASFTLCLANSTPKARFVLGDASGFKSRSFDGVDFTIQ